MFSDYILLVSIAARFLDIIWSIQLGNKGACSVGIMTAIVTLKQNGGKPNRYSHPYLAITLPHISLVIYIEIPLWFVCCIIALSIFSFL